MSVYVLVSVPCVYVYVLVSMSLSVSVYLLVSICFRSGKSSIQKVVFHKMSPNETLFLESTAKIVKDGILFNQ